jgi:hypothetical protein
MNGATLGGEPSPLTVLVLAAGLGSRYGGLKQFDPIGPGGTSLLDYSLFDAWHSGFRRAVFVLRPGMEDSIGRTIQSRYGARLEVLTVQQRLTDLPSEHAHDAARTRPWGTTHAVLAARRLLPGGFAVVNADDCYGRDAFTVAARFLQTAGQRSPHHAVVGFRLDRTVSVSGTVNRAVLEMAPDRTVRRVTEVREIARTAAGGFCGRAGEEPLQLDGEALVSMNLWALNPEILGPLAGSFDRFLHRTPGERDECCLPESMQEAISDGAVTVEVLPTTSRWCGVTHAEDREWVAGVLRQAVRSGEYPEQLWE